MKYFLNTLDLMSFALDANHMTAWMWLCACMFATNLVYISNWCSVDAWYVTAIWYTTIPSLLFRPELIYRYFRNRWLKQNGEEPIEDRCVHILFGKDK